MKKNLSIILTLFLSQLVSPDTSAQKNYSALLDAYVQSAADINGFNGSILIARNEKIIYQKIVGYRDLDNRYPLDAFSRFELASVSEQFTAVAILQLVQKGKIRLSDPITLYFPSLPYPNVTLHHLMTHSSGLPDYYDELMKGSWDTTKYATNADILRCLAEKKRPLHFLPGSSYAQCFTGYPLLASVIEKVTGRSYSAYILKNIFTPLQLHRHPSPLVEGTPFSEALQRFVPQDSIPPFGKEFRSITDSIVGGTGIYMTAADLFTFYQALRHNVLLDTTTTKLMFSPQIIKDSAEKMSLGYGIWMGSNELGPYYRLQDPGTCVPGFAADIIEYPQKNLELIMLTNKARNTSLINGPLAYIIFDREVLPLYIHKPVSIDPSILDRYTGVYELPDPVELLKRDGTLFLRWPGEPDLRLLPESTTKFYSTSHEYDLQFEFETDAKGNIIRSYCITRGLKKQIRRR